MELQGELGDVPLAAILQIIGPFELETYLGDAGS